MSCELATDLTFPVTLRPAGIALQVGADETILAAALRQAQVLPHSCRNGRCGTCKSRVLEGTVDPGVFEPGALSEAEQRDGFVLACQAKPRSALTLECSTVAGVAEIPVRRLVCRVQKLERLADDVMRIRLRMPARDRLKFLPGQYINIVMNGGIRRSLSLANPPAEDDDGLELHLRNYGGPFSQHVFNTMKENDLLRLEGPMGTFFVRDQSARPIIFVASGTGFAPVKAMIEDQARKGSGRPMTLYWGGRRPADLYLHALAQAWVAEHGLNYVPVVSDARPEDGWMGRTGFVHRAVMEDYPDLSGHEVYACGAPIVVESARGDFIASGRLAAADFYADMFAPGAAAPTPAA
ncbi:MAG TPA: CDP-6-deoxy-delta-3,4-glucoseen reductase [Ramlibacter sp.]|nr:CDP-6-deoxy-delta-3,4-glucoseen reductase [Ramlibacter sp.]